VTDNIGNVSSFEYDKMGRKTRATDADTGAWSYDYYNDSDLRTQTDPWGITITMDYDSLRRPMSRSYSGGTPHCAADPQQPPCPITYQYDLFPGSGMPGGYPVGRLTSVNDWAGQQAFSYDVRGRPIFERHKIDGVSYDIQRSYDSMNHQASLTYPDSEQVTSHYNQQGLLDGLSSSVSTYLDQTATTFNSAAQPLAMKLGNGRSLTFGYRANDLRLSSLGVSSNLFNQSYGYDEKGNVSSVSDSVLNQTTTFGYDALDRLTSTAGSETSQFGYDSIDNFTLKSEGTTTYSNFTYAPGRPHAVQTAAENNPNFTVDPSFTANYRYDSAGRSRLRSAVKVGG